MPSQSDLIYIGKQHSANIHLAAKHKCIWSCFILQIPSTHQLLIVWFGNSMLVGLQQRAPQILTKLLNCCYWIKPLKHLGIIFKGKIFPYFWWLCKKMLHTVLNRTKRIDFYLFLKRAWQPYGHQIHIIRIFLGLGFRKS